MAPEVSCIGRTLGAKVGDGIIRRHRLQGIYPHDIGAIVAAACLVHDIGNPPFGHAGEDAIRLWFRSSATGKKIIADLDAEVRNDFLDFEGNAQGFRVVTKLQNPDNPGGLQLTCAALGAFSKYPRAAVLPAPAPAGVAFRKFGFFQAERELFTAMAECLGLRPAGESAWHRHPLAYLVEAADDIGYRIVDIEDAFRLRLLSFEEASALLAPLAGDGEVARRCAAIARPKEKIEFLRAKAIGRVIDQVADAFLEHEEEMMVLGGFGDELLDRIPAAADLQALKAYAEQNVYVAAPVVEVGAAGFEVLAGLLEAFAGAVSDCAERGTRASPKHRMLVHLIPEQFLGPDAAPAADGYQRLLGVTDFISGMTDSYAVTLYKKITGISLPSA
ncbi:MAG: dNTP triphosphohydrolase [Gammaproteobacteria bacterium]